MGYLISNFNIKSILEIGTLRGSSTFFFAKYDKVKKVTTVDFAEHGHYKRFRRAFLGDLEVKKGKDKIICHINGSDKFFETCNEKYDLIFIDGSHDYSQSKRDLGNSLGHLNDGGYIVMHDINNHVKTRESKSCKDTFMEFSRNGYIKMLMYERNPRKGKDSACGVIIKYG